MTYRVVLDASAVVALAHGEPGAEQVEPWVDGSCISTVNWSEVARVCVAVERDPDALRALLADAGCETVDFTASGRDRVRRASGRRHGVRVSRSPTAPASRSHDA